MELNNIQLPANLVSELYRKSLVEFDNDNQKTVPERIEKTIKWLGNNQKNILACVRYESAVFLPDEQLAFLTNMLGACRLSLQDVAIINIKASENWKEISQQLNPSSVFLFGIEPSELGLPINFPIFQVQPHNKVSFLYTPSLEELEKDKLLKSKLWICLRRLFSI
jgi:hypothetical protein